MIASTVRAITLDFFNTLVFHRDGRGRGRVLMDYVEAQGFEAGPWEHGILYDVFQTHDHAYAPSLPASEKAEYRADLAARVFERLGIEAPRSETRRHADALWQILGPACFNVFPDVVHALEELRARGLPLAVLSNWQCGLRHYCAELGLASHFDHILGSADLGMAKPDGRIFHEAATRLRVRPRHMLHAGDTFVDDYQGGEAAGVQVILVDRGASVDSSTPRRIRDLGELVALIDG